MQHEKCIEFKGEEKGLLGRPNSRFRIILKWILSKRRHGVGGCGLDSLVQGSD
jgi:hypothetical protein